MKPIEYHQNPGLSPAKQLIGTRVEAERRLWISQMN